MTINKRMARICHSILLIICSLPLMECQNVNTPEQTHQAPSIDSIIAHTVHLTSQLPKNIALSSTPSEEATMSFTKSTIDKEVRSQKVLPRQPMDFDFPPKSTTESVTQSETISAETSSTSTSSASRNNSKGLHISKVVVKMQKSNQTTSKNQIMKVPVLPPSYEISLELSDMIYGENFRVKEMEDLGKAKHYLWGNYINVTCIFNTLTEEGFLVEGVRCGRFSGLPKRCFCTARFCRSYVTIASILQFLRSHNASFSKETLPGEGGVELWSWKISTPNMYIEAVYSSARRHEMPSTSTLSYHWLSPLSFTVKGTGRVFLLPGGPMWLQYRVSGWSLKTESFQELVSTPPGVVCPAYERKYMPKLSNQFSLTMETVIENLATIAYERQNYEVDEKIVSFTYRPHLHADDMFFLNFPGLNDHLSLESYRAVHDFKTGIQYMINEKTNNCSIQGIPISALDAAPMENKHVRLKHASELISIHPKMFIYKGTRKVRGVLSDVWVFERGIIKGRYCTVEVFFSHENWTVEVEIFNKVRQVPIGVSSYVANADSPTHWTSIVHTFFYEYSDSHLSWDKFDISPCLNSINRIFIVLTLEVSYAELVHYNIELAKNSVRRAIAGISGVSPLRITDIFMSSRHATGEVDVWFILLEKPDIVGPVLNPRPQLLMAEAYKLLHDITHNHNVSVKLDLSPTKKVFVTIKRGSVETSTEALHPHYRQKSLRFLRAGYTAGSVAGLGFSMGILGTCVGIFVGFLLWKRSTGVPYKVTM